MKAVKKHSALSHAHLCELQAKVAAEVKALMERAEAADAQAGTDGMDLPAELARREELQKRLAAARAKIEAMEAERHAAEQVEHKAKRAAHEKRKAEGKRPGPPPTPPKIDPKAQVNLTDEESRIMPRAGGGFDQCYNAQLSVEIESRLIMTTGLTQSTVDKQQVVPALDTLAALPEPLQGIQALVTDNGYMSEANVNACAGRTIMPLFALGREGHHISLEERFACELVGPPPPQPLAAMKHRLQTRAGKTLYALRKSIVEPVIGIIKSVMGFRQCSLRGLAKVKGE